jgi:hypothetical protein
MCRCELLRQSFIIQKLHNLDWKYWIYENQKSSSLIRANKYQSAGQNVYSLEVRL